MSAVLSDCYFFIVLIALLFIIICCSTVLSGTIKANKAQVFCHFHKKFKLNSGGKFSRSVSHPSLCRALHE